MIKIHLMNSILTKEQYDLDAAGSLKNNLLNCSCQYRNNTESYNLNYLECC